MSVFSVPVTIGINEEEIAQNVAKNVEDRVVKSITDAVSEIIFTKRGYYGSKDEPLRILVKHEIEKKIIEKEDLIVEMAATKLAEKLVRTKAVKDKVKAVVEEVYK